MVKLAEKPSMEEKVCNVEKITRRETDRKTHSNGRK
jgi:hypothetical protein